MEKFSPENRLEEISQMTQKITSDNRLAGSEDFETIKQIANEYEILKSEMRRNSQTKMLVLGSSVTKFLQQELSDFEKNGTALSTSHNRALKKLERALDFNQDFRREYERKNTRIGDGAFRNLFKSNNRREADKQKIHELEMQNNYIDSFVFESNNVEENPQENTKIENKNTREIAIPENHENQSENTKNQNKKIAENSGTLNFLDKELPTQINKIVFLQIGLNYFNKTNSLKIDGTRNTETEAAMAKFQENFDKKFPNAYKNPNENPFERTVHNLWFELSQAGFDTVAIIDKSLQKSGEIPKTNEAEEGENFIENKTEMVPSNPSTIETTTPTVTPAPQNTENPPKITVDNTLTEEGVKSSSVIMDEKTIKYYAKNPLDISNEKMKILYIQRALNVVKNNISELAAKALVSKQDDLSLTGNMDDRTRQAIEAFQKYINFYKYHPRNEPLEVTGKLDIKTIHALVDRVNIKKDSQSEEIVQKSFEDLNNK